YINGRPDHQKGHHDDCIMSISMALYVAEAAFPSLQKVTNHTKAMIDSWSTTVNEGAYCNEHRQQTNGGLHIMLIFVECS
ncbi:MAG: hypothetical protein RJB25_328, partial [Bacteroidota bacterium]